MHQQIGLPHLPTYRRLRLRPKERDRAAQAKVENRIVQRLAQVPFPDDPELHIDAPVNQQFDCLETVLMPLFPDEPANR